MKKQRGSWGVSIFDQGVIASPAGGRIRPSTRELARSRLAERPSYRLIQRQFPVFFPRDEERDLVGCENRRRDLAQAARRSSAFTLR